MLQTVQPADCGRHVRPCANRFLPAMANCADEIVTTPSVTDGHTKRPRCKQAHALPIMPQHLDETTATAAEHEQVPAMRIALQPLLHHQGQPTKLGMESGHPPPIAGALVYVGTESAACSRPGRGRRQRISGGVRVA
jgi:hypothetical protein